MTKHVCLNFGEQRQTEMQIYCFVEQYNYRENCLQGINTRLLLERGICKVLKHRYSFQICGFVVIENKLIAVFPKGHEFSTNQNDTKDHIRILAATLLRYRQESNLMPEENEYLYGGASGVKYGLGAALWLINDYVQYGLIDRRIRETKIGQGSVIDWARTIKTSDPYVSRKKPVYLNYFVRKSNEDRENKMILLHRIAVQESFRLFGWIVGFGVENFGLPIIDNPFDDNKLEHFLNEEQLLTNVDREIQLIKMVRHFLLGSSENNTSDKLDMLATPYFHFVWEKVCSYVFDNQYQQLKQFVPKPVWQWSSNIKQNSMKQIPDILYKYDGTLYILDAKYYDTSRNLPGWPDLVKQFFYAYSLQSMNSSYLNVMVFPTSESEILKYKGFASIEDQPNLGKIEAVGINTILAMKKYVSYDQTGLREQLRQAVSLEHNNANRYSISIEM